MTLDVSFSHKMVNTGKTWAFEFVGWDRSGKRQIRHGWRQVKEKSLDGAVRIKESVEL